MNDWVDHRADPTAWARSLGVSREAIDLYLESEVIDLHVDSFIWHRILGRDPTKRRDPWFPVPGIAFGHADLPRLREAQVAGAAWIVTTNPLREAEDRVETLQRNVTTLVRLLDSAPEQTAIVTTASEYRAARARGLHASFIGIQGGNALDHDFGALDRLRPGLLLLVTLLHLSSSLLGTTSSPLGSLVRDGLESRGIELVGRLDQHRIFVDLAHASPKTFWDVVRVHDPARPLMVSHTGVAGVHRHWRNVDDPQIRAVAASGGVVGVIFHAPFLGDPLLAGRVDSVARHLEHLRNAGGEDVAALGSDWDGSIVTPRDMPTCLELPRLVDALLRRKYPPEGIVKLLGKNFLRALSDLRG
jgi:membrane dipeptidase